jgi:hypothetical protein
MCPNGHGFDSPKGFKKGEDSHQNPVPVFLLKDVTTASAVVESACLYVIDDRLRAILGESRQTQPEHHCLRVFFLERFPNNAIEPIN